MRQPQTRQYRAMIGPSAPQLSQWIEITERSGKRRNLVETYDIRVRLSRPDPAPAASRGQKARAGAPIRKACEWPVFSFSLRPLRPPR